MDDPQWTINGREFINCNCTYGSPCQFNGFPTYGNCHADARKEQHAPVMREIMRLRPPVN